MKDFEYTVNYFNEFIHTINSLKFTMLIKYMWTTLPLSTPSFVTKFANLTFPPVVKVICFFINSFHTTKNICNGS